MKMPFKQELLINKVNEPIHIDWEVKEEDEQDALCLWELSNTENTYSWHQAKRDGWKLYSVDMYASVELECESGAYLMEGYSKGVFFIHKEQEIKDAIAEFGLIEKATAVLNDRLNQPLFYKR